MERLPGTMPPVPQAHALGAFACLRPEQAVCVMGLVLSHLVDVISHFSGFLFATCL